MWRKNLKNYIILSRWHFEPYKSQICQISQSYHNPIIRQIKRHVSDYLRNTSFRWNSIKRIWERINII